MQEGGQVGIIGAGVSGLGAAWVLSQAGVGATIFEKSRGVSGRAATRGREGVRYDHGANFFRLDDYGVERLVRDVLPTDELVEIPGGVWTLDAKGIIAPGDPGHNAVPKWTYRSGISTLGKLLRAAAQHAEVRNQVCITALRRHDGHWFLRDADGKEHGPFPLVLLTAPAPQAAELLESGNSAGELAEVLAACSYHRQFTFVLGYDRPLERPRPFHALVNADGGHAVAWLSFEDDKPGHVPAGQSVLVVQMSPAWSAEGFESAPAALLPEVLAAVRRVLPGGLPEPSWWESQRWKFAHPDGRIDQKALQRGEAKGLFVAGDALAGKGRVPLALKSGLEAGGRIRARLRA